jgi:hypothetical protein
MLSSDNPVSGTLVQSQSGADLAHFTFSNGTSAAVTVKGVTLNRTGVSADSTLDNVYLFDGAQRLTDAASVSSGIATFNDNAGLFTIPANSTKVISVRADIASGISGQTVGISLSAVSSDGTLDTTLPIAGNLFNVANATLATAQITSVLPNGTSTTDPVSDVRVWDATLNVGTRNVEFTRLALKQINSIDSKDISNFRLLIDGTTVSTVASLNLQ